MVNHAGEGRGEVGTIGQHDQHPIVGAYVELSQRGGDCGRLIGEATHLRLGGCKALWARVDSDCSIGWRRCRSWVSSQSVPRSVSPSFSLWSELVSCGAGRVGSVRRMRKSPTVPTTRKIRTASVRVSQPATPSAQPPAARPAAGKHAAKTTFSKAVAVPAGERTGVSL